MYLYDNGEKPFKRKIKGGVVGFFVSGGVPESKDEPETDDEEEPETDDEEEPNDDIPRPNYSNIAYENEIKDRKRDNGEDCLDDSCFQFLEYLQPKYDINKSMSAEERSQRKKKEADEEYRKELLDMGIKIKPDTKSIETARKFLNIHNDALFSQTYIDDLEELKNRNSRLSLFKANQENVKKEKQKKMIESYEKTKKKSPFANLSQEKPILSKDPVIQEYLSSIVKPSSLATENAKEQAGKKQYQWLDINRNKNFPFVNKSKQKERTNEIKELLYNMHPPKWYDIPRQINQLFTDDYLQRSLLPELRDSLIPDTYNNNQSKNKTLPIDEPYNSKKKIILLENQALLEEYNDTIKNETDQIKIQAFKEKAKKHEQKYIDFRNKYIDKLQKRYEHYSDPVKEQIDEYDKKTLKKFDNELSQATTDEEKSIIQEKIKMFKAVRSNPYAKRYFTYNYLDEPMFEPRDYKQYLKYEKEYDKYWFPSKQMKETMKNRGYPVIPKSYGYNSREWFPEILPEPESEMDKKVENKPVKKIANVTIEESKEDTPTTRPKPPPSVSSSKDNEIKKVNGMTLPALKVYAKKVGVPFKSNIKKSDLHKLIIDKLK